MKTIEVDLKLNKFLDFNDNPTCSIGIMKKETCIFYKVKAFGQIEFCCFSEENLKRRGNNGLGTLIPDKNCVFWRN